MTTVGYARVSSTGQDLSVQLEKLGGCDKVFKEKRARIPITNLPVREVVSIVGSSTTLKATPFSASSEIMR